MKQFFTLLAAFALAAPLQAQQIMRGVLLDSLTKQPVEFANIGLVEKGLGTVSNEKGEYSFTLPDSAKGSIRVSMIGYKPKTFPVKGFSDLEKIYLSPASTALKEVTVSSKKMKVKTLGNKTRNSINTGFGGNMLGSEMAVKLDIKHPRTQLLKFMVNINENTLGKAPVFRLNVYSVDEKGLPNENILAQNIIIEPKGLKGFVEFDLRPYNILLNEDVFVSIEWIKDLGPSSGLYFSSTLARGASYFRQASQDKWEKISGIGIGLHVDAGY